MSADRSWQNIAADVERSDLGNRMTGRVSLRAVPSWLKDGRLVTASLSPKTARRLALRLLDAAERAEDRLL